MFKLFASSGSRDPTDDFWFKPVNASASGETVTAETSIQLSAFMACVRVLAESVAQLPLPVFSRERNGDKRDESDHPLYDVLQWQANEEQTAIEFREQMAAWAVMRGTAVAEKIPGRRGSVDQLVPIHPDHLKCVKMTDASGRSMWHFEIREPGAPSRRLHRDRAFVVRAMMIDEKCPILGIDPVMAQANAIGAAIAAQEFASRFFRNDATPTGIIEHPSKFGTVDDRNVFAKAWRRAFGRGGNKGTAILEHGMKYHQVSVTPEQAQFLETRKYSDVDIARIFRVPPHKIGILDRATFSNIEHQALEFVIDTLQPWLIRWEQAIRRDLITNPRFFVEHNVAGLLRGDIKSRYEAYMLGRQAGFLTVNDIRKRENMTNIGAKGDIFLEPMNMQQAGSPARTNGAAGGGEFTINGQRALLLGDDDEVVISEH